MTYKILADITDDELRAAAAGMLHHSKRDKRAVIQLACGNDNPARFALATLDLCALLVADHISRDELQRVLTNTLKEDL